MIVEHAGGVMYAVPGVPAEMEDMLARAVLPDLQRRTGEPTQIVSRVIRIAGMSESSIAEKLHDVWLMLGGETTIAFLAGGGEVRVRLTSKAADTARAQDFVAAAEASVRSALGAAVIGVDDETLEAVVGTLLLDRGWSLGAAESLTGGALGSRISSTPGASEYFPARSCPSWCSPSGIRQVALRSGKGASFCKRTGCWKRSHTKGSL